MFTFVKQTRMHLSVFASWKPVDLLLFSLFPPSSSSSPTHIPMLLTHSISIYLSITPGCQRYKHFMWCVSVGLHIFLTLWSHCCTTLGLTTTPPPPPQSPAAVIPHYHYRQARQGSSLMLGLGKEASGLKGVEQQHLLDCSTFDGAPASGTPLVRNSTNGAVRRWRVFREGLI